MNKYQRNIKTFTAEFFQCIKLLDKQRKIYLYSLIPINIVLILMEFITIGILAFLLTILLKPEWAKSKPILQKIYELLDFSNYNYFTLFLGITSISIFFLSTFIKYLVEILFFKLLQILNINIANKIIKNAIHSSYEWFLNQNTGLFSNATNTQSAHIAQFMVSIVTIFIESIVLSVVFFILLFQDPILFLVFFVFIGGLSFLLNKISKNILYLLGRKINLLNTKKGLVTREILAGIIDIKIYRQENHFYTKYYHINNKLQKRILIQQIIQKAIAPILTIFLYSGVLSFLIYNIIFYQSLERIISSVALFLAISYRALPHIQKLLQLLNNIQSISVSIIKLKKLKLLHSQKQLVPTTIPFRKEIRLENVVYQYPNTDTEPFFEPLNFIIRKNETIGIIGKTGCGKSTLARLIIGILPVKKGKILIDNKTLSIKNQKNWYTNVGYISQKIFIFYGSVMQNIAIGSEKKDINNTKINYIAKLPWMKKFLAQLPEGLQTIIQEDGSNLSGGQIQRIAIARAIYKEPEVFIFDEATNSLDNATEKLILATVTSFKKNKTIIIIAHRLSTLKKADNIYEIKNKKLIHYNSYEQMLQAQ